MKKLLKSFVASVLGWQVRRLYKKNDFKTVVVVGSVGKTSTKLAVAAVLQQTYRVCYQVGNYNDLVSVPLVLFGQSLPSLFNPLAWLKIFLSNEKKLKKPFPYDVAVLELGTDGPGQIKAFKKYLHADLGVVTALTPEHMVYFTGLPQVIEEELSVTTLVKNLLINADLSPAESLKSLQVPYKTYGRDGDNAYQLTNVKFDDDGVSLDINKYAEPWLRIGHESFAEPQLYSLTAAAAAGDQLGMQPGEILEGLRSIKPMPGRMRRLEGVNDSIILDDTYNASPEAMKAALETLQRLRAQQKIAVLGNMNELGTYSAQAHTEIGAQCTPAYLDVVLTLGPDANKYMAAAAEKNGCDVLRFDSPYEAGKWLQMNLKTGGIVLIKGSQNNVYAEEAVKMILKDPADSERLVRQSADWMRRKSRQFENPANAA